MSTETLPEETAALTDEAKQYLLDFAAELDAKGLEPEHRDAFVGDVANLFLQGVPVDAFETPADFAFKLSGFLAGEGGCGGGCGCGGSGRGEGHGGGGCGSGGGCGCGGH